MSRARLPFEVKIADPYSLVCTKRATVSHYAIVLMVMTSLAISAHAQTSSRNNRKVPVTGVVKCQNGTGMSGVKITLLKADLPVSSAISDENGKYEFEAEAGTYSVKVMMHGFVPQSSSSFALDQNPTEISPIRLWSAAVSGTTILDTGDDPGDFAAQAIETMSASLNTMIAGQNPQGDGVIAVIHKPWYKKLGIGTKHFLHSSA